LQPFGAESAGMRHPVFDILTIPDCHGLGCIDDVEIGLILKTGEGPRLPSIHTAADSRALKCRIALNKDLGYVDECGRAPSARAS